MEITKKVSEDGSIQYFDESGEGISFYPQSLSDCIGETLDILDACSDLIKLIGDEKLEVGIRNLWQIARSVQRDQERMWDDLIKAIEREAGRILINFSTYRQGHIAGDVVLGAVLEGKAQSQAKEV